MTLPDLKGRLAGADGSPGALSAWISYPGPDYHEALLRGGFDAVTFDLQHGLCTLADVGEGVVRARLVDKPVFVRVAIGDLSGAARCIDFGALGIILPMIETEEDAARLVRAIKYPPLGQRSYGPTRVAQLNGMTGRDYFAAANAAVLGLAMIETPGAVDQLDAILRVEGLDGIFVGPSDLSMALGAAKPEPENERTERVIEEIGAKARAAGLVAGIYALTPEAARRYRGYGYGFVCLGSDAGLMLQAATDASRAARL
ncbi:aldolase/citrate lyase family protein [Aurantimonas sp. Leaf443]|uniref:HpcH/HpaI aldolase family protein n=1 Tax=Aurantimonas sp. Leaf443 TaxID=1736378 RepID=UPI000B2DB114|nr:aldolase/citrate lyase family protein [Aurantimonas sp. Leaf443]